LRVVHVGNLRAESANGVQATIAGLAKHLPSYGVDVEVWHFTRRVTMPAVHSRDGVTVVELPKFAQGPRDAIRLPRCSRRVIFDRAEKTDLLHLHSVYQAENIAVSRLGIPYVLTPNGGYNDLVRSGRHRVAKAVWGELWEKSYLRRAASLHAVSGGEERDLHNLLPGQSVTTIPNALDDRWLTLEAPPRSDDSCWLFLGRLALEHKGLDLLLEGYALAAADTRLPTLVLAGPDFRDGSAWLRRRISELGIGAATRLIPPAFGDDKLRLLRSASAFMHTSRWEGLPFAVLEAMAAGCPVLVTPETNLADVVNEFGAGIVVDGTTRAIAAGLRELAAKPAEWTHRAGGFAQQAVRGRFSWAVAAPRMAEMYRAILA
jgi:glycosyltransferase involved in cell wall biosynthesis